MNLKTSKPRNLKTCFVALSGGVDSSVAAALLQEQGYDVIGVFIRVWQPDFLPCSQDEDHKSALHAAAALGIPFKTLDLSKEYKKYIVDAMIGAYRAGRTPNPDVLCNRHIKFGAFRKWAVKCGADCIATGHHARVEKAKDGTYRLLRGKDPTKDQAYFLWMLTQDDLAPSLMPVGSMLKSDVRKYAKRMGLPTAQRKDSQGLCFIGDVDMHEFLSHFAKTAPGKVLDVNGTAIGEHDGALFFTLGQRTGFRLTTKNTDRIPHYVVSKDMDLNTITVSGKMPGEGGTGSSQILLHGMNWIRTPPKAENKYTCEIRYHGKPHSCTVSIDGKHARVSIHNTDVARGQSVVVYDGDECLGGGIAD
jgi:tRNA-specific 2-thiouridylase